MSNKLFQSIVHQMHDAVGRTIGVIESMLMSPIFLILNCWLAGCVKAGGGTENRI